MAEKKERRYVSDNAQLMAEWNWEKNIEMNPYEVPLIIAEICAGHKACPAGRCTRFCRGDRHWQAAIHLQTRRAYGTMRVLL